MKPLNEFTRAYIKAALFSTQDAAGNLLEIHYTVNDIDPRTLEAMIADCRFFQEANANDIATGITDKGDVTHNINTVAGQDFWFTRNDLECGFWDVWHEAEGERLTTASRLYGRFDLYIGDDGLVYKHILKPNLARQLLAATLPTFTKIQNQIAND